MSWLKRILSVMSEETPMPDNRNRKRPIQVKFFVDEKEQALIKKKMEHAGIENMSVYIRKMVIDGYVVKLICLNSVS
ncbi:MAG: plasmid mobilization protein [Acutalibacteraceae bacterium]